MRSPLFVAAAALLVFACQCGPVDPAPEPVGSVEVRLIHRSGTNEAAGQPRTFTTDLGYEVTVERGWYVVSVVELRACPETTARGPFRWEQWSPFGTAWAHGESGPTRLASPTVDDLLRADDAPKTLGTLAPPVGDYCAVEVTLGPADADARDLPEIVDLVGKSIRVEGTFVPPAGGAATPFVLETGLSALVSVSDPQTHVSLPEEGAASTVVLAAAYNRWFQGVELDGTDEAEKLRAFIENVKASFSVRVQND